MEPFVDVAWLRERLGDVQVCDVRWGTPDASSQEQYEQGHVPGAVLVDLDRDLASAPTKEDGRHPMPDPATWSATLGRLGLDRGRPVVAYDAGVGEFAARLVWMLRRTGFDAALLDGGLSAWDGELETDAVVPTATIVPLSPWPSGTLVGPDEVAEAPVVLDARDAARYRGDDSGPDARAGHIPGAHHVPVTANVGEDGRLLPTDDLRARYGPLVEQAGDDGAVASCGSGVTACFDLLVLEHLGHDGRLYAGSWSQWAADYSRRAVVGDEP